MAHVPGQTTSVRTPAPRVEGTRQAILGILRRQDGVSVDALARELGLAGATVRRHLDVLLRDGLISVAQVRSGPGRPRYAFSITEAGAEAFPHHYIRLTQRLIEEIVALSPEETAGCDGRGLAELVFSKLTDRIAAECAPRVVGATLEERARSCVALLSEEGIDFEVDLRRRSAGAPPELCVLGRGCPCRRVAPPVGAGAPATRAPERMASPANDCSHDRRLLQMLLGARVEPLPADAVPHEFLSAYALIETPGEAAGERSRSPA